jgi:hypothetical protein
LEPYLTPPVEDVYRPLPVDRDERNLEEMQTSLILTSLKKRPAEGVEQLTSALLVRPLAMVRAPFGIMMGKTNTLAGIGRAKCHLSDCPRKCR